MIRPRDTAQRRASAVMLLVGLTAVLAAVVSGSAGAATKPSRGTLIFAFHPF